MTPDVMAAITVWSGRLRDLDHEELVVLDPDTGALLWHGVGDAYYCPGPDPEMTRGRVLLHNHLVDTSFSELDIEALFQGQAAVEVVVSPTRRYTLARTPATHHVSPGCFRKTARRHLAALWDEYRPEEFGLDAWGLAYHHPAVAATAAAYGLAYRVERLADGVVEFDNQGGPTPTWLEPLEE